MKRTPIASHVEGGGGSTDVKGQLVRDEMTKARNHQSLVAVQYEEQSRDIALSSYCLDNLTVKTLENNLF